MTNKFANKSFAPSAQQGGGGENSGTQVDWEALNKHVAECVQEALGCEEGTPSAAVGILSGIVDYGLHQDPERVEPMEEGDAKTKEWKQRQVDNKKATVDENGMFHFQAPPRQEVGFFVDFPNIIVDKGQFFGESNPAPYRVLLGGVFDRQPAQKTKVEGYPNDNRVWVFGDKSRATKLAKAAKLKDLKDGFAQDRLLELIGTAITFNVEVFINSAGYLQEKVTNPSPVMNGVPIPEIDQDLLLYVGLKEDNEVYQVKMLPKAVKDYIKSALDYEGSKLLNQLESLDGDNPEKGGTDHKVSTQKDVPVENKPSVKEEFVPEEDMDFSDDIPF